MIATSARVGPHHEIPGDSLGRGEKQDPATRRTRRRLVEDRLTSRVHPDLITAEVAQEFGISARTVRADMREVRRHWARVDVRVSRLRFSVLVRRLERASEQAERAGDVRGMIAAEIALARVLGLWGREWIETDATRSGLHGRGCTSPSSEDRESLLAEARELWRLSPVDRRLALLERYAIPRLREMLEGEENGAAHGRLGEPGPPV